MKIIKTNIDYILQTIGNVFWRLCKIQYMVLKRSIKKLNNLMEKEK